MRLLKLTLIIVIVLCVPIPCQAFWEVNKPNPDPLGQILLSQDGFAQQWCSFDLVTVPKWTKKLDPGLHLPAAAKLL